MSTFILDKVHSGIGFRVKHMMIATAKGEFKDFDVNVQGDLNNLEGLQIEVKVDASSVNTNNSDRDNHLRSPDFFDVEKYKYITIKGESIKKLSDEEYELTAAVTIRDVTHTEIFKVQFNGVSKHPMNGSTVAGFDVEGKINREKYGLTWNAPLETGGFLVGKDVNVSGNFEFFIQ